MDLACRTIRVRTGDYLDCAGTRDETILADGAISKGTLRLETDACQARLRIDILIGAGGSGGTLTDLPTKVRREGCGKRR
jgi:hypothetical protein